MLSHATACGKHGKGKAKTSQNMSEPKCKIHQDRLKTWFASLESCLQSYLIEIPEISLKTIAQTCRRAWRPYASPLL